jgi:hypothetical protein
MRDRSYIGHGRVARMLATVAHVNSLMERINQWSIFSVLFIPTEILGKK